MLKNTFCHIPGISPRAEIELWSAGVHDWEQIGKIDADVLTQRKKENLIRFVGESYVRLTDENPKYFADLLPSNQHWRLFPEFRRTIAYLDIETTGMGGGGDYVTTIALYDGQSIFTYVRGDNLRKFEADIANYKMIVTYNGKCFDIPFIRNYMNVAIDAAHIDLRFVLKSLGYTGGLKGCEKKMGIHRGELDGVDGFFAVLIWKEYKKNKNRKALETLLAYNVMDVLTLETLIVKAYNLKLKDTPFFQTNQLKLPDSCENPFTPNPDTIRTIRQSSLNWGL